MLVLTRKFHFCASHRLYNHAFTEVENQKIFGKCASPNGHGHNYILEVSICGKVDASTGMVMNITELNHIVETAILQDVDHKHLNLDVPWLLEKIPTTEVVSQMIYQKLFPLLERKNCCLYSVKLFETEKNIVTCVNDGPFTWKEF